MVNVLARNVYPPRPWRGSDFYDRQRIDEMQQERCQGGCDEIYPASVMQWEDGRRKCPNCFEIRGKDKLEEIRNEAQAWIAEDVLRGQPFAPKYAAQDSPQGVAVSMAVGTSPVGQNSPLYLTRGAAAVTLSLSGRNFSTADTFSATSGVTVTLSSRTATQTDLLVSADVGATLGDLYSLTFNGTVFRNIFRVR